MQKIQDKVMADSKRVLSLMQPTYFPWLGYFNLIKSSDIFVVYTTTQLNKRSWQIRNKIKTKDGELMLSIPIKKTKSRDELLIKDAVINNEHSKWNVKHLTSIKNAYSKSKYFSEVYPFVETHLSRENTLLIDLTVPMLMELIERLDINTEIILSSEINYSGNKDAALISICKELNISHYLSVKGSMDYILEGENLFEQNNISLLWHNYEHPEYHQLHPPFIPFIGIIDALFNEGFEGVKNLI